ncbi:IS1-like element transposase [Xenorhabdus japonica]
MKEQIVDMVMNNTDVRDTTRVLKINVNMVIRMLKFLLRKA